MGIPSGLLPPRYRYPEAGGPVGDEGERAGQHQRQQRQQHDGEDGAAAELVLNVLNLPADVPTRRLQKEGRQRRVQGRRGGRLGPAAGRSGL